MINFPAYNTSKETSEADKSEQKSEYSQKTIAKKRRQVQLVNQLHNLQHIYDSIY